MNFLLDSFTLIASHAAEAIVRAPSARLDDKADNSPVTAADVASELVIVDELSTLFPGIPIVSEEATRVAENASIFFLVDPLDGTREYLAGESDYTVNIALIEESRPVAGLIMAPALRRVWRGGRSFKSEQFDLSPGASLSSAVNRRPIAVRPFPQTAPVAVVSRFNQEAEADSFLKRFPTAQRVICGSSLKFCKIGEGSADIYVRIAMMSEWDIAAGHAILEAAGGAVSTLAGSALRYSGRRTRLPSFIATGANFPR